MNMKKTLSFVLMALFCICGYAQTIDPVLLQEMEGRTGAEKIKVIVIMKSQYDRQQLGRSAAHYTNRSERREFVVNELKQFAETSQYELRSTLSEMERQDMTTAPKIIYMANALYFSATKQAINDLAMRRDIELIGLDEKKHVLFDEEPSPASNIPGITSNVTQVNADQVWDLGYTGQGVVVAVIDTGVNYNHLDLADHLWDGGSEYPYHGYNFAYGNLDPMDDYGHGTHCAGTVCGDGTAGKQTGMAPDATLMCVKVLDANGYGEASVTCNAMQWAVEQGCDLFSMSLGWPGATLTERMLFRNTCAAILDAGVIGAIATGNNGHVQYWYPIPYNVDVPGSCPPPYMDSIQETNFGGLSCALCVGAVGPNDNAAYFTSRGPVVWTDTEFGDYPYTVGSTTAFGLIRPDVCAPGMRIISADSWNNAGYTTMSGTSMAAPCVAGCISLMLSKNMDATPAEICQILEETAVSSVEGKSNIYGFGRVDVLAAINELSVLIVCPLTLESFTVNDVQGNNNGNLNAGESVTLDFALMNDSNNALDEVTMVLSTESEYVTITNGTTTLPYFDPGQTQTIENIFAFTLSDNVPGNSEIQFAAEIFVEGESAGIINFSIMVYGYALKLDEIIVLNDNNDDGVLDAGESADLHIVISNMGDEPATSIVGALSTAFPHLIINDTIGFFGDIENDGQTFADFSVTLSSDAPEAYIIDLSLDLVNDNDMHSNLDFELLKGIIVFADANVETICVSHGDTNGDGRLSYEEAASITDMSFDFENNSEITSFDELQYFTGLSCIQSNAFENCSSLTSVILPNSITSIGEYAFSHCTGLTSIEIPDSVTSIRNSAFSHCIGLNSVTIGNSVASIGQSAFSQCRNLFVITSFAEAPPSLGDNAFDSLCSNTLVFVPCGFEDAYTSLLWGGFNNFYGMYGGTVTVVANSEEYGSVAGGGTFEAGQTCTVTATPVEGYVVNWFLDGILVSYNTECTFYVSGDMTLVAHFVPEGNIVFADSNTKTICVSQWDTNNDGELSYGEAARVKSIGAIFSDHTEITSFEELQYFVNLSSISPRAFYGCSGLTGSLILPDSVVSIGSEALYNCSGLNTLIIGNSVTTIDSAAFSSCSSLDSIVLPNSVTSIGAYAFDGCDSLAAVYYTGDVHQWCNIQFSDSYSNPLYYAHNLFNDDGLVTDLMIPETVEEIKPYAFYGASCLTSLTLPNSVTLIGESAFNNCTNLGGGLTIPNTVIEIGNSAFRNCSGLTRIDVLAVIPPTLYDLNDQHSFYGVSRSIPVFVPCGSSEAYNETNWNEFTIIDACPFEVNVTVNPTGAATINGAGNYINLDNCTLTYEKGPGYVFLNWMENGEVVSTDDTCSFVVTEGHDITANFMAIENHWPMPQGYEGNMTVTTLVTIDGVEQTSDLLELAAFVGEECRGAALPINMNGQCVYCLIIKGNDADEGAALSFKLYDHQQQEELDLLCTNELSYQNDAMYGLDAFYVLNFLNYVIITATADPEEGGTVTGAGTYNYSETATLTATANEGYIFVNWSENDEVVSSDATFSFTVTGASALVANFSLNSYIITANADPTAGGSITGSGTYSHFETCTLTAIAEEGYTFVNWTEDGEEASTDSIYSFEVTGERNLVANFVASQTEQTVELSEGWSWWSTNLDITLDDLKNAIADAVGNDGTATIKTQDGAITYRNGHWRGNGIQSLDIRRMYEIQTSVTCEITLVGTPVNPSEYEITITPDNNWIGFLPCEGMTLGEAFGTFPVDGDVVTSKNLSSVYRNGHWRGQLNALRPSHGYIYQSHATGERSFVFPTSTK